MLLGEKLHQELLLWRLDRVYGRLLANHRG